MTSVRMSTAAAAAALWCACAMAARADDAAPTAEMASKGKEIYAHDCSHCHGFNMVNPGTVSYDLRQFPHEQKDRFFNSVAAGKGNIMPPWGDKLSYEDIDALWAYILTGGH